MTVTIHKGKEQLSLAAGADDTAAGLLEKAGFNISMPCAGLGICGKCKIRATGALLPPDAQEKRKLSAAELSDSVRLACILRFCGDADIFLPEDNVITAAADIYTQHGGINPLFPDGKCTVMAVDIGTTTVAYNIYSMPDFTLKANGVFINPQVSHGADVVSRISFSLGGGREILRDEITDAVKKTADAHGGADYMCITGNTAMLHFYNGFPVDGLAKSPFEPVSLFGNYDGNIYFPPCVSSFVGADITCAVLSCGMMREKSALLIDLGTNGEMAYLRDGVLTCCSTAAGPVFEGAAIECGMNAVAGAIDSVKYRNGRFSYTVIGGKKPAGICGSGIIDAVYAMLQAGIIDDSGYLENNFYIGDSGVYITPADVRSVQLAKAAIRAGAETLLKDTLPDKLFIAGGFGKYVDKESCAGIGLIPPALLDRLITAGNASLTGASMLLADKDKIALLRTASSSAVTAELATDPVFTEKFMEYMSF